MGEPLETLSLSEDEVDQNHGFRERYERPDNQEALDSDFESAPPPDVAAIPPEVLAALVSPESHDLVLYFEVAGKDGYERRYKFPCWPQGASGVTIGLGYDLGYNTKADFAAAWQPLLAADPFQLLSRAVGLKGAVASAALAPVRHVEIPWVAAEGVYRATTVPRFTRLALATFPGARDLHPHCAGALFSLVYNRGGALSGERRVHMRNIRAHLEAGRPEQVPFEFRAMKALWPASMSGLHKRRDAEAKLFEQGLAEMEKAKAAALLAAAATTPAPTTPAPTAAAPAVTEPQQPTPAAPATASAPPADLEAMRATRRPGPTDEGDGANWDYDYVESVSGGELEATPDWAPVAWVSNDDNSTDYRHIDAAGRALAGVSFAFTAGDLELLIKANRFEPLRTGNRIIFGLRGCALKGDTAHPDDRFAQTDRDSLNLVEARPNHQHLRCVIGVYDTAARRLSGFIANTVPNRKAVWTYYKIGSMGNMLPAGCYQYVVGAHSKGRYPGCLRQDEQFVVLRSRNNPMFDTRDNWDPGVEFPMDNIHPAFADQSAEFSSFGCQTVRGTFDSGARVYTQDFAKFRGALGLSRDYESDYGRNYSYVLLTGLEAAIATRLREQGKSHDFGAVVASLGRLRHGSKGEEVRALQTALGMAVTGAFDAVTKIRLVEKQKAVFGWADGVLSPAMDEALKTNVLKPAPLAVAAAPLAASGPALESARGAPLSQLDALYLELGRRAKAAETYPEAMAAASLPEYESLDQESIAGLVSFGKSAFARVERAAHGLICGDSLGDKEQRQKLLAALGQAAQLGPERVVEELAKLLLTYLFLVPPINAIAAQIIVEKILRPTLADAGQALAPTYAKACSQWAQDLQERHGAAVAAMAGATPDAAPVSSAIS